MPCPGTDTPRRGYADTLSTVYSVRRASLVDEQVADRHTICIMPIHKPPLATYMLIGQAITHRRDPGESHSLKTVVFPGAKGSDSIYDKHVARNNRMGYGLDSG